MRVPRLALFTLTLIPVLRADGLSDLRVALLKMPAAQPVKASIDCQIWSRNGEGKKTKIIQGQAQARLEDGPGGLKLVWDKAELDRVEAATKAKDKGPKQALDALSAEKTKDLLDAAQAMAGDLEDAVVQEDRMDTWQGKPARLLVAKLDAKDMDEEDRKHIKTFSHLMKIWMSPDGTPLGSSEQLDLKGSFFLISFEMHHSATRTFARSGDRLVTLHEESQDSGSGAGQQGDQKTTMDVKL